MRLSRLCGFVLVALLVVGAAPKAHAGSGYGYVCYVQFYTPSPGSWGGTYGYLFLTLYSGPSCTGNFVGGGQICSTNAISGHCDGSFLHDEHQLMTLFGMLQHAAVSSEKLYLALDSKSFDPYELIFYAAGS